MLKSGSSVQAIYAEHDKVTSRPPNTYAPHPTRNRHNLEESFENEISLDCIQEIDKGDYKRLEDDFV
jgi:hypothetical protein